MLFSIAQQPQSAVNVGLHSVQKDHFIIRLSLNKRLELRLLSVVVKAVKTLVKDEPQMDEKISQRAFDLMKTSSLDILFG